VAAKKSPFSIARNPMTCGTAFWRTIIMRKESSTLASAMPSVERVSVVAICEIGVASAKAKITSRSRSAWSSGC